MRVAVIGLGYVGTTTAACLAADGHEVVGVDVNPLKVEMIGRGEPPIIESVQGRGYVLRGSGLRGA